LNEEAFSANATRRVREAFPNLKVLIISNVSHPKEVLSVLETGVEGYLTRQCDEDEIKHAIFAIHKGEKFYCNKVLDIILNKAIGKESEDNCEPTVLSERESEIAVLIAKGFKNKEIADKLCLSHHTVHTHRRNILKKLGVNSASEVTLYALNAGLISA
jgi:DNA-binding NarL/FixJ family response regulator